MKTHRTAPKLRITWGDTDSPMDGSGSILNEQEVDFLLQGTEETGQDQDSVGAAPVVTMRGDLSQISLTDIFQTLALARMEGLLRLRNPLENRDIYFRNGKVRILVPNRIMSRRLGQRLVQVGAVEPESLRQALLHQRREPLPLGQLLVRAGHVTNDFVEAMVADQVHEELFALFTWNYGSFEFFKGHIEDRALRDLIDRTPEFEVDALLLEVARRSDEWERLLHSIGSIDEVPVKTRVPQSLETDEMHRKVLGAIDGEQTWRELGEGCLLALFQIAQVARDLTEFGFVSNLPEADLVALARMRLQQGHPKRALLLLRVLQQRPGERGADVLGGMASLLRDSGEPRMAADLLLHSAQLHPDPRQALALARQARAMAPREPNVLRFLRSTILSNGSDDPRELVQVTTDLVDDLLDAGDLEEASTFLEECLAVHADDVSLNIRKVRLLHRQKHTERAIDILLRLANKSLAEGHQDQAADLFEQALKIDPARREVQRQLRQIKNDNPGRFTRLVAAGVTALLLAISGVAFLKTSSRQAYASVLAEEIAAMITAGDLDGARQIVDRARNEMGYTSEIVNLEEQVAVAEFAHHEARRNTETKVANERLAGAADLLQRGEVGQAFAVYTELYGNPRLSENVREVVSTRMQALLADLQDITKEFGNRLPEPPTETTDRKSLEETLAKLKSRLRPDFVRLVRNFNALASANGLPGFIDPALANELTEAAAKAKPLMRACEERVAEYELAVRRAESERRLDPLFKAAVERARNHDFAGTLQAFRQLEQEHTGSTDLKRYFRSQIERNATIVRFLETIAEATEKGDFATAQGQFRALRLAFSDVPFGRIARLPMSVETVPAGAKVVFDGKEMGTTPVRIEFLPDERSQLTLSLPGFLAESHVVTGDERGELKLVLSVQPERETTLESTLDRACVPLTEGRILATDRSGTITCLGGDGNVVWRWKSGDISGLLTLPVVHGDRIFTASVDGPLRALDRVEGRQVWSLDGVPAEVTPVVAHGVLHVATVDRRLCRVRIDDGTLIDSTPLAAAALTDLCVIGGQLVVCMENGDIEARPLDGGAPTWRFHAARSGLIWPHAAPEGLLVTTEDGTLALLDATTGKATWQTELSEQVTGSAYDPRHGLAVATHRTLYRFDTTTGRQMAVSAPQDADFVGQPRFLSGRLLGGRRDGLVLQFDPTQLSVAALLRGARKSGPQLAPHGEHGITMLGEDRKILWFQQLP